MASLSPMQRTLAEIKKDGLRYWIVETWKEWAKRRIDLFHIIDLLVLDNGVRGIQVCSGSDYQDHVRKITEEHKAYTIAWLKQPGTQMEIWAWRQLKKKRGGKAMVWAPRVSDVLLIDGHLRVKERSL